MIGGRGLYPVYISCQPARSVVCSAAMRTLVAVGGWFLFLAVLATAAGGAWGAPYAAPLTDRGAWYPGERGLAGEHCTFENGAVWCRLDPAIEPLPVGAPPPEPERE